MKQMNFNFGASSELLTPIGIDGVVKKSNPFFSSNDISPAADINLNSSSLPSKRDEMDLPTPDKFPQMNEKQMDDEFFASLKFIDFGDFETSDLPMDEFCPEAYLHPSSLESTGLDGPMASFAEKSMFLPALDSTVDSEESSAPPWVGEECTIGSGSGTDEDVHVPLDSPMPSVSSFSSASSPAAMKRSSKGSRLSTVERRLRKKDQNKSAAEKYRLKKRVERDELANRQTDLKNQNRELKFELENLTFRLEQFKQLFVDVLQIPIPPSQSK